MIVQLHNITIGDIFECDANNFIKEFFKSKGVKSTPLHYISQWSKPEKQPEKYEELLKQYNEAEDKEPMAELIINTFKEYRGAGYVIDDAQLVQFNINGIKFVYGSPITAVVNATNLDVIEQVNRLSEKFLEGLNRANELAFNFKANAPVINEALLMINEVIVENDFCTEMLQDRLNEGYRIISVCHQPDQRRPDYVLGRYNKENI